MKRIFALSALLFLIIQTTIGQVPQAFNYQAIARDKQGNPVVNKDVVVEITIRASSPIGTVVWQEGHLARTNEFGLVTLKVGEGASTNVGSAQKFEDISWGVANHYLGVRFDFGNGLENMGNTQLLSVPYAIFALEAGNSNAQTLSLAGNQLSISGGNSVTITDKINDADADPNNEIQTLILNGNNLSISSGNTITFPGDNDADPQNEIQTLSIVGDSLEISLGNRIGFPSSTWQKNNNDIYYHTGQVTIGDNKPFSDSTILTIIDTTIKNSASTIYAYSKGADNFFNESSLLVSHIEGYNGTNEAIKAISDGIHFGSNKAVYAIAQNGAENYGVQAFAKNGEENYGVQAIAYGNKDADSNFGLYGISAGKAGVGGYNVGVYGSGEGSAYANSGLQGITYGVGALNTGVAGYSNGKGSGVNYGLFASAKGSGSANIGATGEVLSVKSNKGFNAGIFADARPSYGPLTYGLYAIGDTTTGAVNNAGFFVGDLTYTGSLNAPSDAKLKYGVSNISTALSIVKSLRPVSYNYHNLNHKGMYLPDGKQFGFIAQELEEILPELVSKRQAVNVLTKNDNTFEFKSINYIGLIPILTSAINEQQTQILNQEEQIRLLKENQEFLLQKLLEMEKKLNSLSND